MLHFLPFCKNFPEPLTHRDELLTSFLIFSLQVKLSIIVGITAMKVSISVFQPTCEYRSVNEYFLAICTTVFKGDGKLFYIVHRTGHITQQEILGALCNSISRESYRHFQYQCLRTWQSWPGSLEISFLQSCLPSVLASTSRTGAI